MKLFKNNEYQTTYLKKASCEQAIRWVGLDKRSIDETQL